MRNVAAAGAIVHGAPSSLKEGIRTKKPKKEKNCWGLPEQVKIGQEKLN